MQVGAEGGIRTPTGRPTRPSSVRVCQFHHFGTWGGDFGLPRMALAKEKSL